LLDPVLANNIMITNPKPQRRFEVRPPQLVPAVNIF